MIEEEERCVKILRKNFNNPSKPTPESEKDFADAKVCHICGGDEFSKKDYKVRDYCQITGDYRGASHLKCGLNFQLNKKIPVVFHNLRGYDGHIIMQNISGFVDEKHELDVIPNSMERYMSFFLGEHLRFIDSFQFMSSSLDKLSKNLDEYPITASEFKKYDLLTKKGVYPYEYMDSFERFDEKNLPTIDKFRSSIKEKDISTEEYHHAQRVWNEYEIKNLGEYHDLYLKTDVLLLADVFENFRNVCMKHYQLDPTHYFTAPGLSWDALLKMSGQELELFTDVDKHLMVESGMRGGVSCITHRYAEANNKYMENYDPNKESSYIMYLDANNLYGSAMSMNLPVGGFKWGKAEYDPKKYESGTGAILEVDLEYPKDLHDLHNDYPLAPEQIAPQENMLSDYCKEIKNKFGLSVGKYRKLAPNLMYKTKYVVHHKNLAQYLSLGMVLKKVHRVLEFDIVPSFCDVRRILFYPSD